MKSRKRKFTMWILMVAQIICVTSCAADDMEERVKKLATALSFSATNAVQKTVFVIFAGTNTLTAGDFQVKQKRKKTAKSLVEVEILDKDGLLTATGHVITRESFEAARAALLRQMVECSMMIEDVIQKYKLLENDIGDLSIGEMIYDRGKRVLTIDPSVIHFIRGGAAFSIYTADKSKDAREIAKAIDRTLLDVEKK